MKKTIVSTILALIAITSTVRADAVSSASNALAQAQALVTQAQSAYNQAKTAATSAGLISPTNSTVTTAPSTNASVTTATTPAPSTNSVLASAKETVNDAVVDILRGANSAGKEIYGASKQAITKAVDFTAEQAPLVVREFLYWKFTESALHLFIWLIPIVTLFYFARVMGKKANDETTPAEDRYKTDKKDYAAGKWILRSVALILLTISLGIYLPSMLKIVVAPRVYLIDYVVNVVQTHDVNSSGN